MGQAQEMLRLLGEHHVHDLTDYQQHLVAAISLGWSPRDTAARSARSEKTVYRHVRDLAGPRS